LGRDNRRSHFENFNRDNFCLVHGFAWEGVIFSGTSAKYHRPAMIHAVPAKPAKSVKPP
jgi:hypothetical protein